MKVYFDHGKNTLPEAFGIPKDRSDDLLSHTLTFIVKNKEVTAKENMSSLVEEHLTKNCNSLQEVVYCFALYIKIMDNIKAKAIVTNRGAFSTYQDILADFETKIKKNNETTT